MPGTSRSGDAAEPCEFLARGATLGVTTETLPYAKAMSACTFLILGDQLSDEVSPWPALPHDTVILLIESDRLIQAPRHRTRTALYITAMRAFARRIEERGLRVDYRQASTFTAGVTAHRQEFNPERIFMNHPRGRRATKLFRGLDVELLPDPFYLSDLDEFREQFATKGAPSMEQFYRSQRRKLGVLMSGGQPVGGRWNFDSENRQPLPRDGGTWPVPWARSLTNEETQVVDSLSDAHLGANALAYWPRTRSDALEQLRDALERILPYFGPFEDAASSHSWHLAHSRLSVALNLGLLHPREVIDAVVVQFEDGNIPLASAEGFLRQVIGWREWVWVWHHCHHDDYRSSNYLSAHNDLPDTWRVMGPHKMACLNAVLGNLHDFGWNHHIERLMVLANAATLAGINPLVLNDWMAENFVDGAEWVMEANVIGMGTFADGGNVSSKPYVAGGNYVKKMTNFCRDCRFTPTVRIGEDACPLTNGYWNFLLAHAEDLRMNHRMAPQLRAAQQRVDRVEIRSQARQHRDVILDKRADRP